MAIGKHTNLELEKFLSEIFRSELALEIFKDIKENGGNTVQGIIENLNNKGIRTAKTRVYEEIKNLVKTRIVKRITKRPPIYTTDLALETLEDLSSKLFMDTREELMRKWAASYPFLPDYLKQTDEENKNLLGFPIVNFNTYPIVDIFNVEGEGLNRYFLRLFESNSVQICNTIVDTCLSSYIFFKLFQKDEFSSLHKKLLTNFEQNGRLTMKTLSTTITDIIGVIKKNRQINDTLKKLTNFMDYELREPIDQISSFVIGDKNVFFPIGIGQLNQVTYFVIEIRDYSIIKNARIAFNKAWNNSKLILKVENGELILND